MTTLDPSPLPDVIQAWNSSTFKTYVQRQWDALKERMALLRHVNDDAFPHPCLFDACVVSSHAPWFHESLQTFGTQWSRLQNENEKQELLRIFQCLLSFMETSRLWALWKGEYTSMLIRTQDTTLLFLWLETLERIFLALNEREQELFLQSLKHTEEQKIARSHSIDVLCSFSALLVSQEIPLAQKRKLIAWFPFLTKTVVLHFLAMDTRFPIISNIRKHTMDQGIEEGVITCMQESFSFMSRLEYVSSLGNLCMEAVVDMKYYRQLWNCFRTAVRRTFGTPSPRITVQGWKNTHKAFSPEETACLKAYFLLLLKYVSRTEDAQHVNLEFVFDMYDVWREQWFPEHLASWLVMQTAPGISMYTTVVGLTRLPHAIPSLRKTECIWGRRVETFEDILQLQTLFLSRASTTAQRKLGKLCLKHIQHHGAAFCESNDQFVFFFYQQQLLLGQTFCVETVNPWDEDAMSRWMIPYLRAFPHLPILRVFHKHKYISWSRDHRIHMRTVRRWAEICRKHKAKASLAFVQQTFHV